MKRVLSVLLAVLLITMALPLLASAADTVSGTLATGLSWKIQGDTLTISGNGPMPDFEGSLGYGSIEAFGVPWMENALDQSVKSIVIEEGVTHIGKLAFTCMNLDSARIKIASSVTSIGQGSFAGVNFSGPMVFPSTIKSLGVGAFFHTSGPSITVPDGIKELPGALFLNSFGLEKVYIPASVTQVGIDTFFDYIKDIYFGGTRDQWNQIKCLDYEGNPISFTDVVKEKLEGVAVHYADGNTPSTGSGFNDVKSNAYYANAVAWAMEKGVTSGAAKDKFGVGSPCKREQIATFLWRANGSPEASKTADFADMTNNQVFNKAISWAVEQGITTGVGNNKFGVGQTCTRVQAVTFLWIAAGRPAPQKQAAFSDMTGNPVFNNAISWAVEQGITSGTGNNQFSPNKPCTREQIVTFLYNAYK